MLLLVSLLQQGDLALQTLEVGLIRCPLGSRRSLKVRVGLTHLGKLHVEGSNRKAAGGRVLQEALQKCSQVVLRGRCYNRGHGHFGVGGVLGREEQVALQLFDPASQKVDIDSCILEHMLGLDGAVGHRASGRGLLHQTVLLVHCEPQR